MNIINGFTKGMQLDVHPSKQPEETTGIVENMVLLSKGGNIFSLSNESGTVDTGTIFPTGFKAIGHTVLNNDIIVFLVDATGKSQVGYVRDNVYTCSFPIGGATNNSELGLVQEHPVDCVARVLINGDRVVYYTDNYNPVGFINLDRPPKVGSAKSETSLLYTNRIPTIDFNGIVEDVDSKLQNGTYFFITRYVTNSGGYTDFGIASDPVPVVPTKRSVGVNLYQGGPWVEDVYSGKGIVLTFSDIDTTYREMQIIACSFTGTANVMTSNVVANIPIVGDTATFVYTGQLEESVIITQAEIRKVPISYNIAKCIEQKDGVLFLSNLRGRYIDDRVMQEVANNVEVSYEIEKMQYCNREGVSSSMSTTEMYLQKATVGDPNIVTLTFTEVLSLSTTPGSFILNTITTRNEYSITIVNYAVLTTLPATVTIPAAGIAGPVTYTASAVEGSGLFVAGTDNTTTASNLASIINNDPLVTNYIAIATEAVVKLYWKSNTTTNNSNPPTVVVGTPGDITVASINPIANLTPLDVPAVSINTIDGTTKVIYPDFNKAFVSSDDSIEVTLVTDSTGLKTYSTGGVPVEFTEETEGGIDPSGGYTDFINEQATFYKKTYRRNEVYSLGLMLMYDDGSTSSVYHIPARLQNPTDSSFYNYLPGTSNKYQSPDNKLGTYVSSLNYPTGQGYPGNVTGDDQSSGVTNRRIKHHLMPNAEAEPLFTNNADGSVDINLIKLNFELTTAIPSDILIGVREIVFVRERRSASGSTQNKSVLAQGIAHRLVETADFFNNAGYVQDAMSRDNTSTLNVRTNYHLMEMPLCNALAGMLQVDSSQAFKDPGDPNRGIAYPGGQNPGGGSFSDGTKLDTAIVSTQGMFHSPESVLNTSFKPLASAVASARLIPSHDVVATINGDSVDNIETWENRSSDFGHMKNWYESRRLCNYKNIAITTETTKSLSAAQYLLAQSDRNPILGTPTPNRPNSVSTRWSQGGLHIRLASGTLSGSESLGGSVIKFKPSYKYLKTAIAYGSGLVDAAAVQQGSYVIRNTVYNLEIFNISQYGEIGQAEYIPIKRFPILPTGVGSYEGVFSGDTFITKYAFNTGSLLSRTPYYDTQTVFSRKGYNNVYAGTSTVNFIGFPNSLRETKQTKSTPPYINTDGIIKSNIGPTPAGRAEGSVFREVNYMFVESEINTYYRHKETDGSDYFPHSDTENTLVNWLPYNGDITAYNGQYSNENAVRTYFNISSTQITVNNYPNRTIWSEIAQSDSIVDNYRSFLVNSYYDLPSHTGPIWDSFVYEGALWLHTPKTAWLTYAELSATLQSNTISDVVVGLGNRFSRPSEPISTSEGGYGGTISQWGGFLCPLGYIYPDALQGKVFLLGAAKGGPMLKDISEDGLMTYLAENMLTGIDTTKVTTEDAYLIDNPGLEIGFSGGYDSRLKRVFIQKANSFNISYSLLSQSWTSFHGYEANTYISLNNRLFFLVNDTTCSMWEGNIGDKGVFFGTSPLISKLTIIIGRTPGEMTFNNFIVSCYVKDTGVKVRDNFFNTFFGLTDKMCTGPINFAHDNGVLEYEPADNEALVKYRADEYRFQIPRDIVADNSLDLLSPSNWYNIGSASGGYDKDEDYYYKGRLKGNYGIFEFTYDNSTNYDFVVNSINCIFDPNLR